MPLPLSSIIGNLIQNPESDLIRISVDKPALARAPHVQKEDRSHPPGESTNPRTTMPKEEWKRKPGTHTFMTELDGLSRQAFYDCLVSGNAGKNTELQVSWATRSTSRPSVPNCQITWSRSKRLGAHSDPSGTVQAVQYVSEESSGEASGEASVDSECTSRLRILSALSFSRIQSALRICLQRKKLTVSVQVITLETKS